jgi:large subunit ribosomal protein L18e
MKKTNPLLRNAIVMLEKQAKKKESPIWKSASNELTRTSSRKLEVNVGHLSRIAKDDSTIFVSGKVLGSGTIDKKLVVGAQAFSLSARRKIIAVGGEALEVKEFLKRYPEGSGVILVG